ncbi:hypothetical protein KJ997_00735 [bacterium]|nr:hypothetical protein [bacterium]
MSVCFVAFSDKDKPIPRWRGLGGGNTTIMSSYLSDCIYNGINDGYSSLSSILKLVHDRQIRVLPLTEAEIMERYSLPQSFGAGELDSLIICKHRELSLVTNDKKVAKFRETEGVRYITLNALLRMLWRNSILSKEEIKDLIGEIQKKDRVTILKPGEVFIE